MNDRYVRGQVFRSGKKEQKVSLQHVYFYGF